MRNSGSSMGDDNDMFLYVYATARENTTVTITNPRISDSYKTFNVRAGQQDSCRVPNNWAYIEDDRSKSNRGIKVTSNKPISLYATNQHSSGKYDATNVLPITALMGEYVVQTYRIDDSSTEFAIVATTTQHVTINLKKTTIDIPQYDQGNIQVIATDNSEVVELDMYAGQTYLYRSATNDGDATSTRATSLTGTTICSSKPLALFMGGQNVKIPSTPDNHIFTQAYPTDKWGKTFIVTPTYKMVYDYVQITACQNGTQIRRDGTLVATINTKETFIDTIKSRLYYASANDQMKNKITYEPKITTYTTNKIAECFLYATSKSANHPTSYEGIELDGVNLDSGGDVTMNITFDYGSPVLTPITPQELAMRSSLFATFTKSNTALKHYVNIVTPTSEVSGMRLDGANISADFTPITGTNYSYAIKEVSNRAHKIENVNGRQNSTFTARAYGLGKSTTAEESYAYAVGSRVSRKADILINGQYIKEKTICLSQSINLTGLIEGEYTSYRWDFGDYSSSSSGLQKSHQYSSAGDYDVVLTVTRPYPYICSNSSGLGQNGYVQDQVHVTIHVKDKYTSNFHRKICEGSSVELQGRDAQGNLQTYTYSTNTNEEKHFFTVDGCDSIVKVKIEVGQPVTKNISHTACVEYYWHGIKYTQPGQYTWVGKTQYGCDSTVILDLTINQPVVGPIVEQTICSGSYLDWNGQHITKAGSYTAHLTAANGCDSTARLKVSIENQYKKEESVKLCFGNSFVWRGKTLTVANTYTDHSPSPLGCDSTFILHLSFYPDYSHIQISAETCADKPYKFGNEYISESGTYTKSFKSVAGCDSIVTLTLTVWPLEYDTIRTSICQGERYYFNGKYITQSGEYTKTEKDAHKCTKTTTLFLTVNPVTHKYDTIRTCRRDMPYTYAGKYIADKPGDYTKTLDQKNQYGCDSIYHLHLIVDENILTPITVKRCKYDGAYSHPDERTTRLHNLTQTGVYYDTLQAVNGCDSIIRLNLTMSDRTYHTLPVELCDNALPWRDHNNGLLLYRDTTYNDTLINSKGCDSVLTIRFHVNKTYLVNVDTTICNSELPYNYPDKKVTQIQGIMQSGTYTQTLTIPSGCDSTIKVHLTVNPVTYRHDNVSICEEALPYSYGDHGKSAYTDGIYRDTLKTPNHYGCDSILVLHLSVMQTIIDRQSIVLCDNEVPYNHPDPRATKLQNLTKTGIYRDILKTQTGCDSIIELDLKVWPTYEVNDMQSICDYESYDYHGHIFRGLIARREPYALDTILPTIHGCDSLVHFRLTVYPSYKIASEFIKVCQDTVNSSWPWYDSDNTFHGNVSIALARDTFLADTLHTIHGCDSIFGLQLHIAPIYRRDSIYSICQNERVTWQGRSYCGNKATPMPNDRVLSPGTYYDTIRYQTIEACDSSFYLVLHVYPTYEKHQTYTVCDRDDAHIYVFSDSKGNILRDTIPFAPTPSEEGVMKAAYPINHTYHLQTIHGCDSTIHLQLDVYPTYEFVTRAKICGTENYMWREKMYFETGTYYDSLLTKDGCDSVYVLELFKKPMLLIPIYDTICDNETYEHYDTLWYTNGSHVLVETMVWTPGMTIPQTYSDVTFRSRDDGCDSIVYRYYLKIYKTYTFNDNATICSNQSFATDTHTYTGYEHEYEVGAHIEPYDTIIVNTYTSMNGCDSSYYLTATVYPVYRHRDTITICDDGAAEWRGHHYEGSMIGNVLGNGLSAGEHIFRDSFQTVYGCDSIYELYLFITPTYLFEEYITKCADEDLAWRSFNLDHIPTGEHFYYDSLTTIGFGCDSVYHLYLTVNDTTSEVRHDSICRTESYDFHGVSLMESGYYYDTTLNAWGCHHFTHLHLYVIEPTVPTAWADSICADEEAYDLFYTYTGELDPIAYSLYYDEEGHANGFEDIEGLPITTPEELSWLRIPMPPRVNEDRTKYPRPDYYNIKLVLDNGVCTNLDLCSTDTNIVLSYPSWITRQRFGDVIALYNAKYNGGYYWSEYQWYHGDTLLEGEVHEYLYVPTGLIVGDQYHVRLTRQGETQDFQTCPITIKADPINNDYAPSMGYLSVVQTCICPCHPYVTILSRQAGAYRITTSLGALVKEGYFHEDATEVEIPATESVYIVQLWSSDTPEEPYRSIKVIVSAQCPPHYENIPF